MRRWKDKPVCQMGHRAEDPGMDGDTEPDANEVPLRGRGAEQHSSPLRRREQDPEVGRSEGADVLQRDSKQRDTSHRGLD